MARLHDIMIELKAQVGAITAQRSVASTVVTDNREQPVWNTDGILSKRSNPTPEQGGGNGGGRKPHRLCTGQETPTQTMVTMPMKSRIRKEAQVAKKRAKDERDQIPIEKMRKKTS